MCGPESVALIQGTRVGWVSLLRIPAKVFVDDLHAAVFNDEHSRSPAPDAKGLLTHRAFPVISVCGRGTSSVNGENLNVREVEAFLLDVRAAFPGLLKRVAYGRLSDKIPVIEAKECVVVDHVLNEIEVLRFGNLFEPVQELNHRISGESDFGHLNLPRGTCCAETAH